MNAADSKIWKKFLNELDKNYIEYKEDIELENLVYCTTYLYITLRNLRDIRLFDYITIPMLNSTDVKIKIIEKDMYDIIIRFDYNWGIDISIEMKDYTGMCVIVDNVIPNMSNIISEFNAYSKIELYNKYEDKDPEKYDVINIFTDVSYPYDTKDAILNLIDLHFYIYENFLLRYFIRII